jgi:hypothetical protein
MKKLPSALIIAIASMTIFSACENGNLENNTASKISIDLSGENIQGGQNLLVIDESNPMNRYCRIDSVIQYGFGTTLYLPDTLKDCKLKFYVSAKCRESVLPATGSICLALYDNNENISQWAETTTAKFITAAGKWTVIADTITIDAAKNNFNSRSIRLFSRKYIGKGNFDVDNLVVEIIKE